MRSNDGHPWATDHNGALARSLGQGRAYNEGAPKEALGLYLAKEERREKICPFLFCDYDFGQRNYLRNASLGTNSIYLLFRVSPMISKGDFLALREISIATTYPRSCSKERMWPD